MKPLSLLVHSPDSSPTAVSKVLENKGLSVHLSRSLDDAERTLSVIPIHQIQFVFSDVTLCTGEGWRVFVDKIRKSTSEIVLTCYHPQHVQHLHQLLGQQNQLPEPSTSGSTAKTPAMIGETPQFR